MAGTARGGGSPRAGARAPERPAGTKGGSSGFLVSARRWESCGKGVGAAGVVVTRRNVHTPTPGPWGRPGEPATLQGWDLRDCRARRGGER